VSWALLLRVANAPGMSGRLPEFNKISRLPPDVVREMINSRNAPNLVLSDVGVSVLLALGSILKN